MANTGVKSPGTVENDTSVGQSGWGNFNNVKVSDDTYATILNVAFPPTVPSEYSIKLVKNGIISGDDKSNGDLLPATEAYISYGGSSDLWGLDWIKEDINSNDFGIAFSIKKRRISNYLKATNFGFAIPDTPYSVTTTIVGILVEIEQKKLSSQAAVDHIRMTVYYTNSWSGGAGENERLKNARPMKVKFFKKNIIK